MQIRFVLNEQMVIVSGNGSGTLLDFIRYEAHLKGTKIGCREGDCGACTVLVGTLLDEKVHYKSLTSCLTPLANVHGKHVVTVEGVNINGLNKVQESIVAHSGTQCGFCTPGFVMSLTGFALNGTDSDLNAAIGAMDGNICRCTGYKSLERAAQSVLNDIHSIDDTNRTNSLIRAQFIPEYFSTIAEELATIEPLSVVSEAIIVAGGTDVYVKSHDDVSEMSLQFLSAKPTYDHIAISDGQCILKPNTTVSELMVCKHVLDAIPGWYQYLKLVSSTPIRNIATIAGNLVNASPIGDLTIILLALNSKITLTDTLQNQRTIWLKDFYKGYKTLDKTEDEIITEISFRQPESHTLFNFEKVSKRTHLDIASVNTAIAIETRDMLILSAGCSVGGVGPIPLYLRETSKFLAGRKINVETIHLAEQVLQKEINPISDARGQKDYKRLLARQLFFSHFITLFPSLINLEDLI